MVLLLSLITIGAALDYRTIEFTRDTLNAPLITTTFPALSSLTYCMWLNPKEVKSEDADTDAVVSLSREGQKTFIMFFLKQNALQFYFKAEAYEASYNVSTLLNKWTHVCASYGSTKISVFLNGQLLKAITLARDHHDWRFTNPFEVSIALGQSPEISGDIIDAARTFPGKISEFYFFKLGMSQLKISQIYNGDEISKSQIVFQMSDFGPLVDNDAVVLAPYPFEQ